MSKQRYFRGKMHEQQLRDAITYSTYEVGNVQEEILEYERKIKKIKAILADVQGSENAVDIYNAAEKALAILEDRQAILILKKQAKSRNKSIKDRILSFLGDKI